MVLGKKLQSDLLEGGAQATERHIMEAGRDNSVCICM